ncbi:hypothetical protein N7457_008745 [Penicillium paradoxum]|uniref:uncharacterized protein n=1 Tax=Penicillium paradoxum TaxID=176176 RepID=UPI002549AE17|nr:uncharacterized protein N7457_008745 [Penicillium paradoxum]KAJ5773849.1 hypothetical protein N7457_008745 [Penicillium paradoxum]
MVPKTCDHCNWTKEKGISDAPPCARCSRLKISESTSRRYKRMKYRSAVQPFPHRESSKVECQQPRDSEGSDSDASSSALSQFSSPVAAGDALTPESTDFMIISPERLLASPTNLQTASDALRIVMDFEKFSVIHSPFMLGSRFIPDSRKTVYAILKFSAPILTEGYLAFLGLMTNYQKSPVMRRDEPDICQAAKGLQRLRSVNITHDYDAAGVLFLGQIMYVFNVLTAPYSNTAHSIVRSALMSTEQWLPRLVEIPILDGITMTPILIDTVECLVHREIPIIRLDHQRRIIVDRYAGLCATLLPHLYDICECTNALKRNPPAAGSASHSAIHDRLDEIEETIRRWHPRTPAQLFDNYGQNAVLAMVTQANMYRLGALLVLHRLRFPLGVEDEPAHKLANGIFSELSFFAKSVTNDASAFPVVFPLTMAMLEIEGPGEVLLERLSYFTVQSASALRLQEFVKLVRSSKETGYEGIWFDLVDTHLGVAMPP